MPVYFVYSLCLTQLPSGFCDISSGETSQVQMPLSLPRRTIFHEYGSTYTEMFGIKSPVNSVVQCFKTVFSKICSRRSQWMLHIKFPIAKLSLEKLIETVLKEFLLLQDWSECLTWNVSHKISKKQHSMQSLCNHKKTFLSRLVPRTHFEKRCKTE